MITCINITTIYRGNYTTLLETYACIHSRVMRILSTNKMFKKALARKDYGIQNECLTIKRLGFFAL